MRLLSVLTIFLAFSAPAAAQELPKMKFNEVREIAPGVFFRYSAISATDKSVEFGGSNNIWVVFDEYVVVFDANFPKEAEDVVAAVKKTTDKPIRYVVDSHHHGDHAYGNAVYAKVGASVIAQYNCARLLRIDGPKEFKEAGKGPKGRKDVAASVLRVPDVVFDEKLVLDDGKQRVEFLFLGHAHTAGDCFAYLPRHKILCTGDACTNGPFNYMGHSDVASWIQVLDKAQQLDVKIVCPGHGPLAGPDVLKKQQRFFIELRDQVKKGIDAGKEIGDITKSIDMPWHKEWTGIEANTREDAIKHVFDELVGRYKPWDLFRDLGIYEGPSPTKDKAGWTAPKKIIVPNLMPARLWELKQIAPDILFVPVMTAEEAAREAGDADAVLGFCSADIVKSGKRLRWIQVGHAGVEKDLVPEVVKSDITLTNLQRIHGPNVSEQAFALLLGLTRGVAADKKVMDWWRTHKGAAETKVGELNGKTMLVVGLGGIGMQIAKRAHAFGMRVLAVDPSDKILKPDYVFSLSTPEALQECLGQADVVVLACPLTEKTRGMIGAGQLTAMKKSAYLINIARGGLVDGKALIEALKSGQIAGAGLDVADPEPLPDDHPLWRAPNVLITPHIGGRSPEVLQRQWRLYRENVRRFVAGEPLLCVVDKTRGH